MNHRLPAWEQEITNWASNCMAALNWTLFYGRVLVLRNIISQTLVTTSFTAEWSSRSPNKGSMTPSQMRKGADSLNHRHETPIDHTRSQVKYWNSDFFFAIGPLTNCPSVFCSFRSQQPRWRLIRRRRMHPNLRRQFRTNRIWVTLYHRWAHGIPATTTTTSTTIPEKSIGLVCVKTFPIPVSEISVSILPISWVFFTWFSQHYWFIVGMSFRLVVFFIWRRIFTATGTSFDRYNLTV